MSRFGHATFVPRQVHEPGGIGYLMRQSRGMEPLEIPRQVAGWRVWHPGGEREEVTWAEVIERRRVQQRERLEGIRWTGPRYPMPAQVWVFHNDFWLFGGWWCYLRTRHGEIGDGGPKGNIAPSSRTALELMRTIPLGVLPAAENWEEWAKEFARVYRRRPKGDPRVQGILTGWTDGSSFHLQKPVEAAAS